MPRTRGSAPSRTRRPRPRSSAAPRAGRRASPSPAHPVPDAARATRPADSQWHLDPRDARRYAKPSGARKRGTVRQDLALWYIACARRRVPRVPKLRDAALRRDRFFGPHEPVPERLGQRRWRYAACRRRGRHERASKPRRRGSRRSDQRRRWPPADASEAESPAARRSRGSRPDRRPPNCAALRPSRPPNRRRTSAGRRRPPPPAAAPEPPTGPESFEFGLSTDSVSEADASAPVSSCATATAGARPRSRGGPRTAPRKPASITRTSAESPRNSRPASRTARFTFRSSATTKPKDRRRSTCT